MSKLIAEFEEEQKKPAEEEQQDEDKKSSSAAPSPKLDGEDDPSSSSSPVRGPSKRITTRLLPEFAYETLPHGGSLADWGGGWSNRLNRGLVDNAAQNPTTMEAEGDDRPMDGTEPEDISTGNPVDGDLEDVVELISVQPNDRDVNPQVEK